MTRKHFEAIAKALRSVRPEVSRDVAQVQELRQWVKDCETVTECLKQLNPNFRPSQFKRACGLNVDV